MSMKTIARIIGCVIAIGVVAALYFFDRHSLPNTLQWVVIVGAISALIAFIITPYITVVPVRWMSDTIRRTAVSDLIAAGLGLTVGLIIAVLLALPLRDLPSLWGQILPFVGALLFGYLGVTIATIRKSEFTHLIQLAMTRRVRDRDEDREKERDHDRDRVKEGEHEKEKEKESPLPVETLSPILLDTSSIIDGRIKDISLTGFINGTLLVPRFVLNELQRIADSADTMRRNRGRRGLEILNDLQKDATVPVEITDADVDGIVEVDGKLVQMARILHCPIITNDFNLNRVAELQGVKVLNINELANAIKPVLLPGEDIHIKIMQDGKELGQGVGYLDDGTMIVVENGRQFMGTTIEVSVTRVLQTVAGRMVFAHPKQPGGILPAPQSSSKQK